MIRIGDSLRMTMMKAGDCEDNTEGWGLFKDDDEGWELFKDDNEGWELFKDEDDRRWEL